MSPEAAAALDVLCDQLARATMARKVLLCSPDGTILAHVGESGLFTPSVSNALARLVADLLVATQLQVQQGDALMDPLAPPPGLDGDEAGDDDIDDHFAQVGRLRVCATPLAARALLVVLFDESVEAGLVRVRVRRARRLLLRLLGDYPERA